MVMDEAAACRPCTSSWVPLEPSMCVCVWSIQVMCIYSLLFVYVCAQISHTCVSMKKTGKRNNSKRVCVLMCLCVSERDVV